MWYIYIYIYILLFDLASCWYSYCNEVMQCSRGATTGLDFENLILKKGEERWEKLKYYLSESNSVGLFLYVYIQGKAILTYPRFCISGWRTIIYKFNTTAHLGQRYSDFWNRNGFLYTSHQLCIIFFWAFSSQVMTQYFSMPVQSNVSLSFSGLLQLKKI